MPSVEVVGIVFVSLPEDNEGNASGGAGPNAEPEPLDSQRTRAAPDHTLADMTEPGSKEVSVRRHGTSIRQSETSYAYQHLN